MNFSKNFQDLFDVADIFEHVDCKMVTRKLLKLKWTHESVPTAWGLIDNRVRKFT